MKSCLITAVVALTLPMAGPATAAEGGWSPLERADGHALAVALDDGTTALVSVGGPDDATVYDQRRTADGELGPQAEITTVDDAEACRPVAAATALGNVAVAVECQQTTGLEDPPTRLLELVWTGDDGWVSHVQDEGVLGSVDYSPQGQYALFTSNSQYGRAHHLTSYHADLGWRDLTRRQLGGTGDDLVAAVDDGGDVVALRGAGFEDEPGYWFGGRLRIETYREGSGTWQRRLDRRFPDGGIEPMAVDLAGGRIMATAVRSRSTGQVHGLADKVLVLSGAPDEPRTWSSPRWNRDVLTAPAALTRDGVGVAAWQVVRAGRVARPWFATWAADRARPWVRDLEWETTLTHAVQTGRGLDLAVGSDGHGAIAYVRHRAGVQHAEVGGASFRVTRTGGIRGSVDVTWRRPVGTTVAVTASATTAGVTLGRMTRTYYSPPVVQVSTCCDASAAAARAQPRIVVRDTSLRMTDGLVVVPVECLAPEGATCAGSVRLRGLRHQLGQEEVDLDPGRHRLRIDVFASGQERLARECGPRNARIRVLLEASKRTTPITVVARRCR